MKSFKNIFIEIGRLIVDFLVYLILLIAIGFLLSHLPLFENLINTIFLLFICFLIICLLIFAICYFFLKNVFFRDVFSILSSTKLVTSKKYPKLFLMIGNVVPDIIVFLIIFFSDMKNFKIIRNILELVFAFNYLFCFNKKTNDTFFHYILGITRIKSVR